MSEQRRARALARLSANGAVLALARGGPAFGVFLKGDRRCRPIVKLTGADVRTLQSDGAIAAIAPDVYTLSAAGRARVRRETAPVGGEAYLSQHATIGNREVVDAEGDVKTVRALEASTVMRRLAALRGGAGGAWLTDTELTAANRLRQDWAVGEIALVRGSDWTSAPMGDSARGVSNAQEFAMARRCDARRRVADALALLAPPLRRVVERVCLYEEGLEAIERAEGWPSRSGKLALKLGLAQLAAAL